MWWIVFPVIILLVLIIFGIIAGLTYLFETFAAYWSGVSAGEIQNRDPNGFILRPKSELTISTTHQGLKASAYKLGYLSMYRRDER